MDNIIDQLSDLIGSIELIDSDIKDLEDFADLLQKEDRKNHDYKITIHIHTSETTPTSFEMTTANQCWCLTDYLIKSLQSRRNELKKVASDIIGRV